MNDSLLEPDDAATPLSMDERAELIPSYVTLRHELNDVEQANILKAENWAFTRKRNVLDEPFLLNLHKRMFGEVWGWAGQYRRTERNIGIEPWQIGIALNLLIDDTRYWVENRTFGFDEIAARFHHKLVWIHPFPNGNGRHARLATDLLLLANGLPRFTWGRVNLVDAGETRKSYVTALRAADRHDIDLLLKFVRS